MELPAAHVGSGVGARPDELSAVRKCILAAARALWPEEKLSWKSLTKCNVKLLNPHWQAGLVDSLRTGGPQLLTGELTTELDQYDLYENKNGNLILELEREHQVQHEA